ncbi:MAG: CzcE family metal-binding protein [Pseudomonadota bacterium]
MRAIFISYRRDDTEGHAGRLFEDLRDRFGKNAVFMDVTGIEPGRDFRRVIEQQVASCGVLLALIGKNWLSAADASGKRRLDDAADFVRLETASALKRDIPVIPVLVHDAAMPRVEQLPDDLKELAFRNAVELTHARWSSDVQLLIDALLPHVDAAPPVAAPAPAPPPGPAPPDRQSPWMNAALTVFVLGGVGYVAWDRLAPSPSSDAALAPGRRIAAAPAASAPAPAAASAPAPIAVVPVPASAPAPTSAPARVIDKAVIAKPPPAPRPVVKVAPPPPTAAARPSSAPVPAASPAPLSLPSAPPAPAPAPVAAPTPVPSAEVLASRDPGSDLFGSAATVSMVTRRIVIKPETGYVNVTGGEVIRFDVGAKSFVWNFNGTRSSFDLGLIAPAGLLGRKVTAYVAPNPMYPKRS